MSSQSLSPAVNSAADVLDLLAEVGEPLSGSEIARRIGRAKSTVSNIVAALEQTGLVERSDNTYRLGRKLVELAGAYLTQTDLVAEFHRICRSLPVAKDETLSLSSFHGDAILYLAHHNGSQPVRWFANVGARLPIVDTAMGVAMLSTYTEDELAEFFDSVTEYAAPTPNAYRSEDEVRAAIQQARIDGYAVGDQLNTLGLCSLARPVRSRFDNRKLAVGVTMLSARRDADLESALLADLQVLAESLPPATD
ncbi:MAG: IclR family transcriptional regulator [Actinomycetota bacterium]